MGRERTRKGKYLFLYPAFGVVLILGFWGCVHFQPKWKGEQRLARAGTLLAEGKYEDSMRETNEVLRLFPRTLGDEALFYMGLIYAHPKNRDRDYEKSLKWFQRVIKEFPRSELKDQADVGASVLQEILDKEKEIIGLRQRNSYLGKTLRKEKEKVKELEGQLEKSKVQVGQLHEEVKKLKEQLLRLKEIDLGVEEKKSQAK
ncbi:MAG: tetratricopeptide repeat protein [Thermodesulfobacteriota bacterium]|nr:tetratricopeptide repeat protein [Thermodesulfobacteriota bacterium]